MSRWKFYTPDGVQDILFDECYKKRNLENKIRLIFRNSGYSEIETPSIEFYDVFSAGVDAIQQENMFKFFDKDGRILVLRSDMTIPSARVYATKLKERKLPVRIFYIGNSFNYSDVGGGRSKEFTQAGVEILGVSGPKADAEVIATAVMAIKASGLDNFQIDIGQANFFKGIIEEAGFDSSESEEIRKLVDKKDFVGIEQMLESKDLSSELKELILGLPGYFGSVEVLDRAAIITKNEKSLNAIDNLRQILKILDDYGVSKYISIDLGMVNSLNYYTGIIFKGFTFDVGFPILSGGRYDTLIENYGEKCAATGFSLGINMLMMAISRQKICADNFETDLYITYSNDYRKEALKLVNYFRGVNKSVELDITCKGEQSAKEYATLSGCKALICVRDCSTVMLTDLVTEKEEILSYNEVIKRC